MLKNRLLIVVATLVLAGCLQTTANRRTDTARAQQEKAMKAFTELDQSLEESSAQKAPDSPGPATADSAPTTDESLAVPESRPAEDFSSPRYLTATGIGRTDAEAREMARAELSRIFESRIQSNVTSRARSVTSSVNGERFEKSIEADIRIASSMTLKGVTIAQTRYDESSRSYYAEAALDRYGARDEWQREIEKKNAAIDAEYAGFHQTGSPVRKLKHIQSIMKLWLEKEVLASRLRVIGFTAPDAATVSLESMITAAVQIKSDMLLCLDIQGKQAPGIVSRIKKRLAQKGFHFTDSKKQAHVLLTGKATVAPVQLNNPDYKFSRAALTLDIIDRQSGTTVGTISRKVRKAHVSYAEAEQKAVQKLALVTAGEIESYFDI